MVQLTKKMKKTGYGEFLLFVELLTSFSLMVEEEIK
jgi:hypothetical protein